MHCLLGFGLGLLHGSCLSVGANHCAWSLQTQLQVAPDQESIQQGNGSTVQAAVETPAAAEAGHTAGTFDSNNAQSQQPSRKGCIAAVGLDMDHYCEVCQLPQEVPAVSLLSSVSQPKEDSLNALETEQHKLQGSLQPHVGSTASQRVAAGKATDRPSAMQNIVDSNATEAQPSVQELLLQLQAALSSLTACQHGEAAFDRHPRV